MCWVPEISSMNIVDLSSDDDIGEVDVKAVKLEPDLFGRCAGQKLFSNSNMLRKKYKAHCRREGCEENRSLSAPSTGQSGTGFLDQVQSPIDDASPCSTSPVCAAPICRQFWKAGNYDSNLISKSTLKNGSGYLHVHPRFLHSNATSHKWAFGAIAELLDNAVDEIHNGATFVILDKTSNPRNGNPALLIHDDGGGMDPEAMRNCLSFGFSDKRSKSAIGQYGNGFKTSTMRLGADVIVFSRHSGNRKLTQSIGLLSYTFLTQTGHDRIVVPMVDYEFNSATGTMDILDQHDSKHFLHNLSLILQWSPYSSEAELLKQFDDVGYHGTKIIIYNLWFNDVGDLELDFESNPEDIHITGAAKSLERPNSRMVASEQHIANRLFYSLRTYLSILYLQLPESFCILLRGRVVEYHNIATELKFPEFIKYRPNSGGCKEVVTTVGFLKEAPDVNIHGFNIYHKKRLILPFWRVLSSSSNRGRGVVGVLEANFIEPTHNKQDFERTSLFQKLESRLKEMTVEYWNLHCELIGYQVNKKCRTVMPSQDWSDYRPQDGKTQPILLNKISSVVDSALPGGVHQHPLVAAERPDFIRNSQQGAGLMEQEKVKQENGTDQKIQPVTGAEIQPEDQEATSMIEENKKLRAQCFEYEKNEEELNQKVVRLRNELSAAKREYVRLLAERHLLNKTKNEKIVNI